MRGVYAHIQKRDEEIIGVLDTFHSKAGWGVSWVCQALGKRCIDFWPKYKADEGMKELSDMRPQQQEAWKLGAKTVPMKAGRSAILYHSARRYMAEHYPGSYLMPNALKLPESITETAAEVKRTPILDTIGTGDFTLCISISSGTIAAGVMRGLADCGMSPDVILHMGYSRSKSATQEYIEKKAGVPFEYFNSVRIIDEGYNYKDRVDYPVGFPCNPYYDLKAWKWLRDTTWPWKDIHANPILFWNIGE
jgi:hypothetical protein